MIANSKKIDFTKMHGAGNDYIYINGMVQLPDGLPQLAIAISDRHFGVGSDGLVAIVPSAIADFKMRMFNADGSEAEMCGNASRCIGKYVFEKGLTSKTEISLETLAGIKILKLHVVDGEVESVTVDMGAPETRAAFVPATTRLPETKLSESETIDNKDFKITAIGMGNPHAIIFVDKITDELVLGYGPKLEVAPIFPKKANIEFARIISPSEIEMRVWERGSGETWACGTGACATLVAAVLNGLTSRRATIHLLGGDLHIEWNEETNHVMMTGPAQFVADGTFYWNTHNIKTTDEN